MVLNIKCAILRSVVENDLVSPFAKVLSVNLLLGIIITIVKMNLSWHIMLAFFFFFNLRTQKPLWLVESVLAVLHVCLWSVSVFGASSLEV